MSKPDYHLYILNLGTCWSSKLLVTNKTNNWMFSNQKEKSNFADPSDNALLPFHTKKATIY